MKKTYTLRVTVVCFYLVAILISGCATSIRNQLYYSVNIDSISIADVDSRGKSYVISSAMKDISDDDLHFKEFTRYIENALSQKGYKQVNTKENADLLIRLAYGIGEPKTETYAYRTSYGYSYQFGNWWYTLPHQTEIVSKTTYNRFLLLEVYDLKTPDKPTQIWKTTLTSEGKQSDLRIVLPHIIAAAIPHFGTNTGRKITVTIDEDDTSVINIGYPAK